MKMALPLLKSTFLEVAYLADSEAWVGHIPFAFWIVEAVRPRVFVELGTHSGNSYFAFCQSIEYNHLPTRCFAVDTWEGDSHAGFYGEEVFKAVSSHNETHYQEFSTLLKMTFDDARPHFERESVDILHIDGLHTYESVMHDFETWLPKLSERGIVIFHDISIRDRGFGVWKLWEEVSKIYPSIEFKHSNGLGVLIVGKEQPQGILDILSTWNTPGGEICVQNFFQALGEKISAEISLHKLTIERDHLKENLAKQSAYIYEIRSMLSWKIAAPIRAVEHIAKRLSSGSNF